MNFTANVEIKLVNCKRTPNLPKAQKQTLKEMQSQPFKILQCILHCHYDLRKYSFTNRVTSIWNSLPNHIVTANNLDLFKTRLDTFWKGQEVFFNWEEYLKGTGSQSMCM